MRFIEPQFPEGCVGAWCPSVNRSGRYLIDHSNWQHRLELAGVTHSDLWPDGLRTNAGRAVSAVTGNHLINARMTFSVWVYPTALSGTTWIGGAWRNGDRCYGIRLSAASVDGFFSSDGTSLSEVDGGSLTANAWNHIAISIGPVGIRVYRDGRIQNTDAGLTAANVGDARFSLGTIIFNDPAPFGSNFQGRIDDVQLYNRQLLDAEVQALGTERAGLYRPRRARRTVKTDVLSVESLLSPAHEVSVEIVSSTSAASVLALTHEAQASGPALVAAASELSLADEAVASGPKSAAAVSVLSLVSEPHLAQQFVGLALSALSLADLAVHFGPKSADATDSLLLTDTADTSTKFRTVPQSIALAHDVQVTSSKLSRSFLTLVQTIDRTLRVTSSSQLLDLLSRAEVPHSGVDRLALSQAVGVVLPAAGRFAHNRLTLLQTALATGNYSVAPASVLTLLQAVAYSTNAAERLCRYSPFVGGGAMPASIPPADDAAFIKGLKLEHGVDSLTISRSMSYGDINRLVFDRINRTSRGGTLLVFADPIWPRLESLVFSVSGIKRDEARAFLDFLEPRIGQQMTLTTHEGRRWLGVIVNPQEAVIQDAHESYTLAIEFQGAEV